MAKFPMIIVNTTLPLVLRLNPNPNSIQMERAKVFSKTQTLNGWVFEHWGEQPRTLRVKGRTQAVLGPGAPMGNTDLGVEAALFALQKAYDLDKRPLTSFLSALANPAKVAKIVSGQASANDLKELSSTYIYYKFDLYTGFFTNFSYEQVAEEHPRHYEYQFEFLIVTTAQQATSNAVFGSALGPLAGVGLSAGTGVLAGNGKIIKGITGLNI